MAQAASIVINDREATPVAHTFTPRSVPSGLATFKETAPVPIGEKTITVSTRHTAGKDRFRMRFEIPHLVTEIVNGVNRYSVTEADFAEVTFTMSEKSTDQDRKNLAGFVYNSLAATQTMIMASVVGREDIW